MSNVAPTPWGPSKYNYAILKLLAVILVFYTFSEEQVIYN